jgi:hypothetical protein
LRFGESLSTLARPTRRTEAYDSQKQPVMRGGKKEKAKIARH